MSSETEKNIKNISIISSVQTFKNKSFCNFTFFLEVGRCVFEKPLSCVERDKTNQCGE